MNVRNKTILITGGAGGLGSAMARLLSENGAKIVILDLEAAQEKGDALVAELKAAGGEAWFCGTDVTSEEAWKKAVDFAWKRLAAWTCWSTTRASISASPWRR